MVQAAKTSTIGIYSFPKSGNTWIRHLLAATFGVPKDQLVQFFPELHEPTLLQHPIIDNNRELFFYKSHSAYEIHSFEAKSIKNDKIIYISRNPLDVFVSHANYLSQNVTNDAKATGMLMAYESVDKIVGTPIFDMLFSAYCLYGTLQPKSVAYGSWFENVEYFKKASETDDRIVFLRYEELINNFNESFAPILQAIGRDTDNIPEIFKQADKTTAKDGGFFWKRSENNYKNFLTPEQIDIFLQLHGERCKQLGYDFD